VRICFECAGQTALNDLGAMVREPGLLQQATAIEPIPYSESVRRGSGKCPRNHNILYLVESSA